MADPIRKRFGYAQHAARDRICSSKEGSDHTVQNRPGSDLDGLVMVRTNASGPEASRCARTIGPGSAGTQPARYHCHFPTFRIGYILPQTAWMILCKNQPGSDLVLADCVRFGVTDPLQK